MPTHSYATGSGLHKRKLSHKQRKMTRSKIDGGTSGPETADDTSGIDTTGGARHEPCNCNPTNIRSKRLIVPAIALVVAVALVLGLVLGLPGDSINSGATVASNRRESMDTLSTSPSTTPSALPSMPSSHPPMPISSFIDHVRPSVAPSRSPSVEPSSTTRKTNMGTWTLLRTIPHDTQAFTQGLEVVNGTTMYESNGLHQKSNVRIIDMTTGSVVREYKIPDEYFAEGLTYYVDENGTEALIQLTWRENTGFRYRPQDLQPIDSFQYTTTTGQGWGIAYHPREHVFYVSDGSEFLHMWDANTLQETTKTPVFWNLPGRGQSEILSRINELEWDPHTDTLLANVWFQDVILRIEPSTGFVTTVYDFSELYPDRKFGEDVFNGIATTDVPNEVWVTGKMWPNMYLVLLQG